MDKSLKSFLFKTFIFLALFILISAIIGQKIVASSLLYGFYIYIYGGMGYIFLFSIAGFILLYRNRIIKESKSYSKYNPKNLFFLLTSFILVAIFFLIELNIKTILPTLTNILGIHLLFLSIFIFLILGIFGKDFIKNFFKKFKKELLYFLVFGIITYFLMNLIWSLWPYFSLIVLKAVYYLLHSISSNIQLIAPRTLIFNGFAAQIAEACSGIYSIFLFTALYLFIILLDWKKINKTRAVILFLPAVIGAFLVNILRVFLLFIIGAYVSREAALGLYHSYTGMIFFLIYFGIFWFFAYKYLKEDKSKKESKIKKVYSHFMKDSLYRNSIYLMLSTLIMAFLGFIFWMINARLFTPEQVGLATTIISIVSLITSLSVLGLNTALIRFLPKSDRKNDKINTAFTLVALITIIISTVFLLLINQFSPKLLFIKENIILAFVFIIFMVFGSISSLIDSIFVAYRSTKFILFKSSLFSLLKIMFVFFFVSLGAYGIFTSWMIAVAIASLVSIFILSIKFQYSPKIVFYDSIIKRIGKYSFGNYFAGFIGSLPTLLLPLIIINNLSSEIAAFYYIAMMIANLIFIIPSASSQSLFAEGSYDENNLKPQIKKAIKITSLLLIPAILLTIFLGKYILLLFGKSYSSEGFRFLQILAFSGIFVSINSVFASIWRIKKKIKQIIIRSAIGALITLSLSYLFIHNGLGLLGIGYAWIIGQAGVTLLYLVFLAKDRR